MWEEPERGKAGQVDRDHTVGDFKCPAKEFHPSIHPFIEEELHAPHVLPAGAGRLRSALGSWELCRFLSRGRRGWDRPKQGEYGVREERRSWWGEWLGS